MIKEQNPSNLFCGADGGIFHITWELLGMAQDISHHHSDFQHKKCEERVFPTANTSSLAAKPHQSLFHLLTISSNIIPILITVHVLLCFGPFPVLWGWWSCVYPGASWVLAVPRSCWRMLLTPLHTSWMPGEGRNDGWGHEHWFTTFSHRFFGSSCMQE